MYDEADASLPDFENVAAVWSAQSYAIYAHAQGRIPGLQEKTSNGV